MPPQPMYQQIADDLRRKIETGDLAPDQQLPTELELREEYKASRNTVRDAIKRLSGLGLVESRPGSGTFVTRKIDPFITILSTDPDVTKGGAQPEGDSYRSEVGAARRKATTGPMKVTVVPAPDDVAAQLEVRPGSQVVVRSEERFIDKTPWSLLSSYYPFEFTAKAPRLLRAEDIDTGAVRYLEDELDLKQTSYRDWITARAPGDDEQKFFGIAHDSIVFEIFRTGFDQHGNAMRVTVTVCPADRNQFIVNIRDPLKPRHDEQEHR
jgi:GntR family transcriptional regulator